MPRLKGTEVLKRVRENPPWPHLKIIMVSGRATPDEMAHMMLDGANDYLAKPFSKTQLQARVKTALRLKDAQDRSDRLHRNLLYANQELEQMSTFGIAIWFMPAMPWCWRWPNSSPIATTRQAIT